MALARRTLLLAAAALAAGRASAETVEATDTPDRPADPPANEPLPAAPERFIWLRNSGGEEVVGAYRTGEAYDDRVLARIRRLMRDTRQDALGPLPTLLVDMMSVLQEQWAYTRPIVVHSGYRTPLTNATLEGAAPASLHLSGSAVDMSVPRMAVSDLAMGVWTLSRRIGLAGIGVYPGFVHMDIGPQRVWTRWAR
jgi:uncharacterized protein YcbK (DUF882 family)